MLGGTRDRASVAARRELNGAPYSEAALRVNLDFSIVGAIRGELTYT